MLTAQQVTYERPPEGLARGRYPAPVWVIIALAALIVVVGAVFLIIRARAPRPPVDVLKAPGDPSNGSPRDGASTSSASNP